MTYTVETREGCILITGSVSISQASALLAVSEKGAVLSDSLARLAGAQLAWGKPSDVEALEDKLRAEKLAGLKAEQAAPRWGSAWTPVAGWPWAIKVFPPAPSSGSSRARSPTI